MKEIFISHVFEDRSIAAEVALLRSGQRQPLQEKYIESLPADAQAEVGLSLKDLSSGHYEVVASAKSADGETLARLGDDGPFDAVIHMAAHAEVGESVAHPERYYRNNVIRSLQLLEWARQAGWGGIVFSSSL